jgi:hypothetical protein
MYSRTKSGIVKLGRQECVQRSRAACVVYVQSGVVCVCGRNREDLESMVL